MINHNTIDEVFDKLFTAPLLFVGSGFTRRYCGAPAWEGLLDQLARLIRPDQSSALSSFKHDIPIHVPDNQLYPYIASKMEWEFNQKFFHKEGFAPIDIVGNSFIENGVSPFRVYLAKIFSNVKKQKLSSSLQEELSDLKIASKHSINGIITTNYDRLLEQLFPEFDVYIGQDDLIFSKATGYLEIYKIHGCCSIPSSFVFTKEDYELFHKKKCYLTAKLLSFFMEHPILFIGYSASDPNMNEIFESLAECLNMKHLEILANRMIFVEYDPNQDIPNIGLHSFTYAEKHLTITKITTSSYSFIFKKLIKIKRNYSLKLLKQIKQDLYLTVTSNSPSDIIRVVSSEMLNRNEEIDEQRIIGFSGITKGHKLIETGEMDRDAILHDANIDIKSFVEDYLPAKMKECECPIFNYVRSYIDQFGIRKLPDSLKTYIINHRTLESFLTKSILKQKTKCYSSDCSSIDYYINNWENIKNPFSKITSLAEAELKEGKLFKFLEEKLKNNPEYTNNTKLLNPVEKTALRRLIRICDWIENKDAIPQLAEDGEEIV